MSTDFRLLETESNLLCANESGGKLSIDIYQKVVITIEETQKQAIDWIETGSIDGLTKRDLRNTIDRLEEIYDMDTLF